MSKKHSGLKRTKIVGRLKLPNYDAGGDLINAKNSTKDAATAAISAIPVYGQILAPILKLQDSTLGKIGENADGTLKKGFGAALANVSNPLGGFSDLANGDINSFIKRSSFGLLGGKTKAEAAAELFAQKQHQDTINTGTNNYVNSINSGFKPNGNPNAMLKDGGKIKPEYEAEHGEVVVGAKPKAIDGGKVVTIKKGVHALLGNTHEEGGIALKGGDFVFSNNPELHTDGETPAEQILDNPSKQNINAVATDQEMRKGKSSKLFMRRGGPTDDPYATPSIYNQYSEDDLVNHPVSYDNLNPLANRSAPTITPSPVSSIRYGLNNPAPLTFKGQAPPVAPLGVSAGLANRVSGQAALPTNSTKPISTGGKFAGIAGSVAPFIDNITNAFLNSRRAGREIPDEATTANARVNLLDSSAAIAGVKNQIYGLQKGLDTTSAGQSNSNKIAATATGIDAINNIQQETNNANAQIGNTASLYNQQNEQRNNKVSFENRFRKLQGANDIDAETSANVANFSSDLSQRQRDNKSDELVKSQQAVDLASADPRGIKYLKSQLGDEQFNNILGKTKRRTGFLFGNRRSSDSGVFQ